jgi:uroporphyrinogen decarboxylase
MTSRELVRRAIRFEGPERLPFTGAMGETDFSGDTVAIFPDMGNKWWLGGGGTDEWGCRWEVEPGSKDMGQVKNRVLERIEDYASVAVPDALNPDRYRGWDAILKHAEAESKYVVVCNGPYIFERAHFLRGFEHMLMDIVAEPELTQAFLRQVARYHLETVRYIGEHFAGRIHGYRGTDDWGTQTGAIISPASFRHVFQPVYRELFTAIHGAGMDAWLHSCGQNLDLLPALIEAGLDVINLMQPNVFPIPRLAQLKGRVCFEVCADAQTSLPQGNQAVLAAEIQGLLDACCTDKGGLIEVKLDRMYFDGDGVRPEIGAFCHEEYRRRDPFFASGHSQLA